MKIRALANGNVIDAHEDAAKVLIANGIYEEYDEKAQAKASPTAVAPMTTASMPAKKSKAKK